MTTERERIDRFADEFERFLVCSRRQRARRREELLQHLYDAAEAGGLDEAFDGLGGPEQAAAAFATEYSLAPASLGSRLRAALVDNLPLLAVAIAVSVQQVVYEREVVLSFPPLVHVRVGPACLALVSSRGCGHPDPWLLYVTAMPVALLWSIVILAALESRTGTTPGKRLVGLRVITEQGVRISFGRGLLRRVSFLLGPLAWLDWFPFLVGRRRRLLDYAAGTQVVAITGQPPARIADPGQVTPVTWRAPGHHGDG